MKQFIKKIGLKMGFWYPMRRLYKKIFRVSSDFERKYRAITRWQLPVEGIDVSFDVSDMYSKKWFLPRYDNGKYHEPVATQIFIDTIKETDTVLDVGVHLGYFTCLAARLASKGKVFALEVDPNCIPKIERNVELNKFNNVSLHNVASSDHVGEERIAIGAVPNPSLKLTNKGAMTIPSTTIDAFIVEHNISPNFIKVDVEGAEGKVLNGMKETLRNFDFILLIEIHVVELEVYFNTNYKELLKTLFEAGFTIKLINEHRSTKSNFQSLSKNGTLSGNTMLWCEKK